MDLWTFQKSCLKDLDTCRKPETMHRESNSHAIMSLRSLRLGDIATLSCRPYSNWLE